MNLFDCADQLRNRAASLDRVGRREDAETLREQAMKLATEAGVDLLQQLQSQINELSTALDKLDAALNNIRNTQAILQAVNQVVGVVTDIVRIIKV